MNYSELQREVKSIIQDASPEVLVSIPDFINEAVQDIAGELDFPYLRHIYSITTSTTYYYVQMTSGFNGRLTYCGNSDGEKNILGGLVDLMERYPGLEDTGDVVDVALEDAILYYQGMPSTAETLLCLGYANPDTLTNDTDTPSFFPAHLHREYIVNKALEKAYNMVEDALEFKDKINTKLFAAQAEIGKYKVMIWLSRRRVNISRSTWSV